MTSHERTSSIDVSFRNLRRTLANLPFRFLKRIIRLFDLSFLALGESLTEELTRLKIVSG